MSKRRLLLNENQLNIESGGVQSITGTAVDNTDPLNPIVDLPDFLIIDKGVSTATGFYTPALSDLSVPFNIFRNTSYSWLSSFYDVRRIIEIELSGDCTIQPNESLTMGIKVDSNRYANCQLFGGSSGLTTNWIIKFIITISSTSEVKISGLFYGKNQSDVSVTNENIDFSSNRSISVEAVFSSNAPTRAIRSNQIYLRILS